MCIASTFKITPYTSSASTYSVLVHVSESNLRIGLVSMTWFTATGCVHYWVSSDVNVVVSGWYM